MHITHQPSLFNMSLLSSVVSSPIAAAAAANTIKKCISLTGKGVQCKRDSILDDRCKSHNTIYKRDNPSASEMLILSKKPNARCAEKLLNKCRLNKDNSEYAFMLMYATRKIYDPSLNLNKFITGGGAEEAVCLLFKSVGIEECENVSSTATIIDLTVKISMCIENDGTIETAAAPVETMINHTLPLSLKNSASINLSPILENYRGDKRTEIRDLPPTLIIYTEDKRFRIVYLDHDIIKQAYPDLDENEFNSKVYKNSDSNLSFNSKFLRSIIPRLPSEYILNVNIPNQATLQFDQKNIIVAAMTEARKQLCSINKISEPDNFFPSTY